MDRIIFGDNQFFGVNHVSEAKSQAQSVRFKSNEAILQVLECAMAQGIQTFMCTTHDRIGVLCKHIRHDPKFARLKIYPCMPYAHKYGNAVTELGILGALNSFMPRGFLGPITKGGLALLKKDFYAIMELMVDVEMSMFQGITTPVIFLQNIITDLLLGLGMDDFLVSFHQYICKKYNAEAGFITMNLPLLLKVLERRGISYPIICTSINKVSFRMPGGTVAYEQVIAQSRCRLIAMQVFAGGALSPAEALRYVCNLKGVNSILFGASSKANISETRNLIEAYSKPSLTTHLAV